MVGCPSVCFIDQQQQQHSAGLLLSPLLTGDIDRSCRLAVGTVQQVPARSSNGAAAWCSAANVGSIILTADGGG